VATLTLTVPDAQAVRILNAYCGQFGYSGEDTNAAKIAFMKLRLYMHIKRNVIEYEALRAQRIAMEAGAGEIEL